jgi:hypothetical protein
MTAHELHHLFFDELKICGCGIPESIGILVRDVLAALPPWDHEGELKKLLPTDGLYYFVLGVLTDADLLEHGSNIVGSWLTPHGEDVLESLRRESAADEKMDSIFGCNHEPPEDCEKCYPKEVDKQ